MTERSTPTNRDDAGMQSKIPAPQPRALDAAELAGTGPWLGAVQGDPRLSGRATAAQRIAIARQLQRTHGNSYASRLLGVQRELAAAPERLTASRVRVVVGGLAGLSFSSFQSDIASGIAVLVHRGNVAAVMADPSFLAQLRDYHGSLLGASPEMRTVTLEIAVDRSGASPRASLSMATNPQTGELDAYTVPTPQAEAPADVIEAGEAQPPEPAEAAAPAMSATTTSESSATPPPIHSLGLDVPMAVRIPLNESLLELPPMPYGLFLITTRLRVRGALTARATGSVAARWARFNVMQRQAEAYHVFANEVGQAQFELTRSGCTIQLMGNSIRLAVRINGNVLEFVAPGQPITGTIGDLTFDGTFGLSLAFEVNGNPAAVDALLEALATSAGVAAALAGVTAAGTAVARFGAALAEAVSGALQAFAESVPGFLPIVVLPGAEEMLEQSEERFTGGGGST